MGYDGKTDEAGSQRVRLGDPAAFAALALRYWGAVHRIARSMLPDASEADEATEETFLLALRSAERFPPDVPFRTSLYRIAMERSLVRLRAWPRARADSAAGLLPEFDATGRLAEGSDPEFAETLIRRRDLRERIREGLERIDDLDRASFILRDVEQLPGEEVAAILGTSPGEIRERTHRARLMMTGFLSELQRSPASPAAAAA